MTHDQQETFRAMWYLGEPLSRIAERLGVPVASLTPWVFRLDLQPRSDIGNPKDGEIPTPDVIRLRCQAVQTAWTVEHRAAVWRGTPEQAFNRMIEVLLR